MAEFRMGVVRANEINFHFLEMGAGPLVLCMHGFPDNAYSFRHLLPELAQAGFWAVAPFMRGYAPTGAPADGRYQAAALTKDALALIEALGAQRGALIGNDWGARAVYGAAALEPEGVACVVTLASTPRAAVEPRDFYYLQGTWHVFYFQMPNAEATVAYNDYAFLEDWWRHASPEWDIPSEVLEGIKATFRQPGVLEAALSYYRQEFTPAQQDPALKAQQERINSSLIPVTTLAVHGTSNRPRRLEAFQRMDHLFTGGLEKVVVEGTGHFLHLERPQEVNPKIVEFLKAQRLGS